MLTPDQYEAYCRQLEERRAGRPHASVWPTPDTSSGIGPIIEIGPGRGDLSMGSQLWPSLPTSLALIGYRRVASFARLYEEQPWIAACVTWILQHATRVPLGCYRKDPGGDPSAATLLRPDEHPLAQVIHKPWNRGSTVDLVQHMLGPVLVHGNSVIEIDDSGRLPEFVVHDWRFCRPIMPTRASLAGFTFDYDIPQLTTEVSIDKVLHTHWWSPAGPIGTSPLQQLGVTIQIEDGAQRYQRNLFFNGARPPSAVVASDVFLTTQDQKKRDQVIAQLRSDITEIYSGPENAGRPALLPPGLDWKMIGHSSVEVALIDQRKLTREEICAVYLIPLLAILGLDVKGTTASLQVLRDMVYTECLAPHLVQLEQTLNAQFVRDLMGEDDVFYQFDFGAVLRGDRLAEVEFLRNGVSMALLTPNEGRSVLNLPKSDNPGMDEWYLPYNNLQPVGSPPQSNMPPVTHFPSADDPQAPTGPPRPPGGGAPGAHRFQVVRQNWRVDRELRSPDDELDEIHGLLTS